MTADEFKNLSNTGVKLIHELIGKLTLPADIKQQVIIYNTINSNQVVINADVALNFTKF